MDYTISEYSDPQDTQIVALHAQLLAGGNQMSRSYLRWKYMENPFIRDPLLVVVRHGKRIVAMRGISGSCWRFGSSKAAIILPQVDDLIIHPDHRDRGLFLRINEMSANIARDRGFLSMVSLSAGEVTQRLSLVCGWQAVGELERMYRYTKRRKSQIECLRSRFPILTKGQYRLRRIARRFGYISIKAPSDRSVDEALRGIVTLTSPHLQLSTQADYVGMSALDESIASGLNREPRSAEFLRWRLRNPQRRYRFLYWRDSSIRGYMVLAWTRRDASRVLIADQAAENNCILKEMMDAMVRSRRGQLGMMASTMSETALDIARTAGFRPDPEFGMDQRRRFLFYPLTSTNQPRAVDEWSASYPHRWRIGLLDTMGS